MRPLISMLAATLLLTFVAPAQELAGPAGLRSVSSQPTSAPLSTSGPAQEARADPSVDQVQIRALEKKLFEPSLSLPEVVALLRDLRDETSRQAAVAKLIAGAGGLQDQIAADVATEADVNVTQAAAAVVEALDSASLTSTAGKQLRALYARQGDALIADAWKDFRKNPMDGRASAMLTALDPDAVLAWAAKTGDDRDPLRFVLLRIREIPGDAWAGQHVRQRSYETFLKTTGDVFPAGRIADNSAGVRMVGHTLLRHIWGVRQSDASGLPMVEQVCMAQRLVYVFRLKSGLFPDGFAAFKFDVKSWSAGGVRDVRPVWTNTYRELSSSAPKGLAPLPKLLLENAHEAAWAQHAMGVPAWAKAYAPKACLDRLDFAAANGKAEPRVLESTAPNTAGASATTKTSSRPATAPSAPVDAPTVVVLPPGLPVVVPADLRTQAAHMCDMLEEGLGRSGKVRVVNRSELNKLIEERKTASAPGQPALSYDAMLRLSVDADAIVPRASLTLVDLPTGNPLWTWTLDWPVDEAALAKLWAEVPGHLAAPAAAGATRLKVRLIGIEPTQQRMAPLGLRLKDLLVEALSRSKNILLVQHLEAASSQEESLLIMMGLSRLAGGRRFAPQADATLELRIAESDEVGKAFDEVPIEVSFRLRRGQGASEDWTSFKGTVRDYDALARKAWQALTTQLDKTDAQPGSAMLGDLAIRRKQALAELKAADKVQPGSSESQTARAKLDHIEAALKLDPLCEPAALQRVFCLWTFYGHQWTTYNGSREVHELLLAAAHYNDLFPQNPESNAQVQDYAWDCVRMTPLIKMSTGQDVPITPDLRILLDAMKGMVECSVRGDPRRLSRGCPRYLPIVYRGMRQAGVSQAAREAWMDGVIAGVRKQFTLLNRVPEISRPNTIFHVRWMHLIAAQAAAEDGNAPRARELLAYVRTQLDGAGAPATDAGQRDSLVRIMREVLIKLDDAVALKEFDAWVKGKQTPVRPIWFGNLPGDGYSAYKLNDNPYKPTEIVYAPVNNWPRPLSPLCEGGGHLYALTWKDGNAIDWSSLRGMSGRGVSQEIVRIPLDETGRPKGSAVLQTRPTGPGRTVGWDALEMLPQPTLSKQLQVFCARFIDGKLYMGTNSGLLIFDADKKEWKVVDVAAGLPCWGVYSMYPQGDGTLFCTGQDLTNGGYVCAYYTYAMKSGEIRVLRKTDEKARVYPLNLFLDLWKQDGKLRGLTLYSVVADVMAADLKHDLRVANGEYYCARLGDSLFVSSGGGVMELDLAGKVKSRIPMGGSWVLPGFTDHWFLTRQDVPNDTPASGYLVGDGRYLWFAGSYTLYDPDSKTWYGPLMPGSSPGYCLAGSGGLWIGASRFMWFIDRQKYMDSAKEAGRAVTTQEYVKLRDAAIAQMPPLPQARVLLGQRKFKQARDVLAPHLQAHPDDPIALLLDGMVNDSWGLKSLPQAQADYARLEGMSDPSAKFAGLYMQLHLLVGQGRWEEANAALKRIRADVPLISDEFEAEVTSLARRIEKALAARPATRPAASSQPAATAPGR